MATTASSRAAPSRHPAESAASPAAFTTAGERSPFARTAELLAPYEPGQSPITLSLGEPQHPPPDFVAPILSQYINEFRRYPMARGIEPFRRTAANWLFKRFDLPRAIDPETEILVLNGSREGLFFAAIAAARYVALRKGTPAISCRTRSTRPMAPAPARKLRNIFLPTTRANGFLPDLDGR